MLRPEFPREVVLAHSTLPRQGRHIEHRAVVLVEMPAHRFQRLVHPRGRCHRRPRARARHHPDPKQQALQRLVCRVLRQPGFTGLTPDNETHMERAGPTGCTMLFAMQSDDGRMFEILSQDGKVLATATLDDFLENRIGRSKAA